MNIKKNGHIWLDAKKTVSLKKATNQTPDWNHPEKLPVKDYALSLVRFQELQNKIIGLENIADELRSQKMQLTEKLKKIELEFDDNIQYRNKVILMHETESIELKAKLGEIQATHLLEKEEMHRKHDEAQTLNFKKINELKEILSEAQAELETLKHFKKERKEVYEKIALLEELGAKKEEEHEKQVKELKFQIQVTKLTFQNKVDKAAEEKVAKLRHELETAVYSDFQRIREEHSIMEQELSTHQTQTNRLLDEREKEIKRKKSLGRKYLNLQEMHNSMAERVKYYELLFERMQVRPSKRSSIKVGVNARGNSRTPDKHKECNKNLYVDDDGFQIDDGSESIDDLLSSAGENLHRAGERPYSPASAQRTLHTWAAPTQHIVFSPTKQVSIDPASFQAEDDDPEKEPAKQEKKSSKNILTEGTAAIAALFNDEEIKAAELFPTSPSALNPSQLFHVDPTLPTLSTEGVAGGGTAAAAAAWRLKLKQQELKPFQPAVLPKPQFSDSSSGGRMNGRKLTVSRLNSNLGRPSSSNLITRPNSTNFVNLNAPKPRTQGRKARPKSSGPISCRL